MKFSGVVKRSGRALIPLALLLASAGCPDQLRAEPAQLAPPGATTGFLPFDTEVEGRVHKGLLYVPANYDPEKAWPLIVYFHGIGEWGRDGLTQTTVGLAQQIIHRPGDFPYLVYFPQAPNGYVWTDQTPDGEPTNAEDNSPHVDAGIDRILANYSVDPNRIGLTGISMGGSGVYGYGADHPGLITALMPVAADGNPADASLLAETPVWIHHGVNDPFIPIRKARAMANALAAAGGDVRYTEYEAAGHQVWDAVYSNLKTIEWLAADHGSPE